VTATLGETWRNATPVLAEAGIEAPHREARILLAHAMASDLATLLRRQDEPVTPDVAARFADFLSRRAAREPAATILGHREFWSLDFLVSEDTLIPRPDSETVIEAALACFPDRGSVSHILDLGTGSGCLLLAALTEFGAAWGLGLDRAQGAARVAARNAERLGLNDRAAFLVGDWAGAVNGRFDLVLSNPPYIPAADIAGLEPEVTRHEPALALDGGADGLEAYRRLFGDLARLLTTSGKAVFEFGLGQETALAGLAEGQGLRVEGTRSDLAGHPRVTILGRLQKEVGLSGGAV
jgi:release factor glutamine methyltransferase